MAWRDSSGAANEDGKTGLGRPVNHFIGDVTCPDDSGQTPSADFPTNETSEKVAA